MPWYYEAKVFKTPILGESEYFLARGRVCCSSSDAEHRIIRDVEQRFGYGARLDIQVSYVALISTLNNHDLNYCGTQTPSGSLA
jgi:hypothetical protein